MTQQELTVVLGATGGIGGAVVRELVRRGTPVRAVSRSGGDLPPGVEDVRADLTDPAAARAACAGASVVHMAAQPDYTRWATDLPPLVRAATDAAAAAAGARLVFADNLYMFGPVDGPIREDTPVRPRGKKERVRAAVDEELLAAHAAGRLPVAIGRSSDYYGPGAGNSVVGHTVFEPAAKGKRLRWIGALDVPHTLAYVDDTAAALVTLGERAEAEGRAWHLPAAPPVTGREFLDLVNAALPSPLPTGRISTTMMRIAGVFNPLLREFPELMHQHERPWVVDSSAYEAALGPAAVTPHAEAVRRTLDDVLGRPAGARTARRPGRLGARRPR